MFVCVWQVDSVCYMCLFVYGKLIVFDICIWYMCLIYVFDICVWYMCLFVCGKSCYLFQHALWDERTSLPTCYIDTPLISYLLVYCFSCLLFLRSCQNVEVIVTKQTMTLFKCLLNTIKMNLSIWRTR